ncbi:hypothetical protein BJV74DRAFT_587128 [Russula compacta]|nr:hypothetical protein BJV74DRAFT_587128 [Russula compacta]
MVNFSDPAIVEQDLVSLRSFWHAINGVFVWEFLTTLDYELDIIRGRRPYRWTIWVYSLTRLAALVAVILNFIGLDVTTPYNCQAWITFGLFFGYWSLAAASLLIIFRIIAIWNKNKVVVAISISVWAVNVSAMVQGLVRIRAAWDPLLQNCIALNIKSSKLNVIVTLTTDIVLLLIMLVGLLRLRLHGGGTFGIGLFLWKQGLIWLLIATFAEVPPTVFIMLNLNDPLDAMFQPFSVIVMSIAATRMYRSLADFVSGSTGVVSESLKKGDSLVWKTRRNPAPLNRIEMTVHGLYPTPQTSHYGSEISTNGSLGNEPRRLNLNNDVESAMESQVPG